MKKKTLLISTCSFIAGSLISIIITNKLNKMNKQSDYAIGNLRIDNSEKDENSKIFLELFPEGISILDKSDKVILNVVKKNYIDK